MDYAAIMADVDAGRLVAVAPVVNDRGESSLVVVTGDLPPGQRYGLQHCTSEDLARLAVSAVAQVRRHFEVDGPQR